MERVSEMKALVTGGNGFIGSQLLKTLASEGYSLRILARKSNTNYETVVCNLENEAVPESALDSIDIVFHLAGYAHDLENTTNKEHIYRNINVNATANLIKIANKKGVKRFIYISSVKAGGIILSNRCMTEDDQGIPKDIYGLTKREAELKVLDFGKIFNMHVAIIRPTLVYGPGMKGNLSVMFNGVKGGWFPPLPKINNRRSMICVNDLVEAILLVTKDSRANGGIYIATDDFQYSSREIYEIMCKVANKPIPSFSVPLVIFSLMAKIGDVIGFIPFSSFSFQKLLGSECYSMKKLQKLGFKPKYNLLSSLENKVEHDKH